MVLHLTQIKKGMGSNICLASILPVYVPVESMLPCLTAVLLYVHHKVYYLSRQYHCISREKGWYMLNSITVYHGTMTNTCLTALLYVTGEGLLHWLTWLYVLEKNMLPWGTALMYAKDCLLHCWIALMYVIEGLVPCLTAFLCVPGKCLQSF